MPNYYTGIGSRKTPEIFLDLFEQVGETLADCDFILRSGGANGADSAFEKGCNNLNGEKEIYLPWRGFNNSKSNLIVYDRRAFNIARKYHPRFNSLKSGAQKLMARNTHQILGQDLNTPTTFVICWTPNGSGQGGTGQAIRIAKDYNIPVFDCGKYREDEIDKCIDDLNEFLRQF